MIQEEVVPAPKFTRPLQNQTPKPEGATVKLEAQVTKSPTSSSAILNYVRMTLFVADTQIWQSQTSF